MVHSLVLECPLVVVVDQFVDVLAIHDVWVGLG